MMMDTQVAGVITTQTMTTTEDLLMYIIGEQFRICLILIIKYMFLLTDGSIILPIGHPGTITVGQSFIHIG